MSKPSPPPAPDYVGAAQAQGTANKEAAIASSQLSNPNIISPEGRQTVSYANDPITGNPIPTVTKEYSPELQQNFDYQTQLQGLMSQLGITGAEKAQGVLGEKLDFSGAPGLPGSASETRNKVIDAMMSRTNQDLDRRQSDVNSDLVARGIRPGTKAYEYEMDRINRSRVDARTQAELAAGQEGQRDYGQDMGRRQQAITELLAQRQTPLQEINALRSGSQINPLQFQNFSGANAAPAPVYGATKDASGYQTDLYNSDVGSSNNTMSGLFKLGAAAIPFMMSDRRLKSNIVHIGNHPLGIGIYEYDIFGERDVGVMADEVIKVKPDAVMVMPNGYMAVNYGMLQ